MKFGLKLAITSKKYLIANLCINKNFHGDKMSIEGSKCICLSVILIDTVFRTGKNCYPQVFVSTLLKKKNT